MQLSIGFAEIAGPQLERRVRGEACTRGRVAAVCAAVRVAACWLITGRDGDGDGDIYGDVMLILWLLIIMVMHDDDDGQVFRSSSTTPRQEKNNVGVGRDCRGGGDRQRSTTTTLKARPTPHPASSFNRVHLGT